MSYSSYSIPNTSETVLSGVILENDSMFISSGGTALETTVNSNGTIYIDGGGIAQDTVVNSSGYIGLSSGGMASDTTVNDGGFIDVYSYGKANGVTVSSGGSFGVYFTASATGVEMEEGAALRIYMDYYTILSGTSGGRELSISNGIADGLTIESGGFLYASGYTTVSNTTVKPGGHLAVYDNAAGIIEDGGYVYVYEYADTVTFAEHEFKDVEVNGSAVTVHSGTTATNTEIGSGGTMFVYKGGLANSAAVTGGIISGSYFYSGLLQLYSSASADGITAGSGGLVRIEKGATVTNLTENGGGFEFAEDFDMSGVNYLSNAFSSQTLSGLVTVHSGTTATDIVISSGAFHLYEGGAANNVTGSGVIHSNAVASGLSGRFTVEKGAVVYDLTGLAGVSGTVSKATVGTDLSLMLYSGGKADSVTVLSGGSVRVNDGGTLENAVISGGWGWVSSGGTVTNLTLNGEYFIAYKGAVANNLNLINGYLEINASATVDNINVSSGTISIVGGSVTNLVFDDNATLGLYINPTAGVFVSGTKTDGTPILIKDGRFEHFKTSGLSLGLENGGVADDITFSSGEIMIYSGGTATNIDAGGGVHVSGGGTLTGAIFRGNFIPDSRYESGGYYTSGGGYLVISGGTASDVTFEGADLVMSGGTLQNASATSGNMFVSGNATVRDLTMNGEEVSAFYAAFENTKITDYSYVSMGYGATATGTILSDTQVNRSSGSVTWTEDRGGFLYAYNGGIAVDTTVGNACILTAAYGGSASKTAVNSGGSLYLSAKNNSYYGYEGCGLADDVTVQSGGWIHVGNGASATDLKLEKGANIWIDVGSETLARGTYAGSAFEVKDGAVTADFPVLENGFQLSLYDGSVLTLDQNAAISDGGRLTVVGGTVQGADVITVNQGGHMHYDHGVMDGKIKENGGYFYYYESSSSGGIEFEQNTFTGMTLTFGQSATAHSGTVADSTTILVERGSNNVSGYGALLDVYRGGIATNTTVAGGGLHINSGGTALNTLVHSDGHMELDYRGGASAINTTVKDGGEFMVSGGYFGTPFVSQTYVSSGGSLYLRPYNGSASMTDTVVSEGGVFYLSPEYSGYAVAVDTVIESGGTMLFTSGGSYSNVLLSGTVIKQGASVGYYVSSSGDPSSFYSYSYVRASDTILDSGASVAFMAGESLSNTIVRENAVFEIGSGVYVDTVDATGSGATVRVNSYGLVQSITVGSGASLAVSPYGEADYVVVDGGTMRVTGAGVPQTAAVFSAYVTNGTVTVESGGYLYYASAGAGGRIELGSGCWALGDYYFADGGEMYVEAGGQVYFLLEDYQAPSSQIIVNDLSRITGAPDLRIIVKSYQRLGTYTFASGAESFDGTLSVLYSNAETLDPLFSFKAGETVKYDDRYYTLHAANGNLSLTITDIAGIEVSRGDIDNSGISDVLFQWTGGGYQLGYWMNGRSAYNGESMWKCTGVTHSKDWEVLGNYVMDGNGNADTVLVGNVHPEGGFKGAYIGYYKDGVDLDENWVTIGYLNNEENIDWKNKVGNLTGNADANSMVWYAPELYALGVWKEGTTEWVNLSASFGGDDWTLIGCGDFDGDGKDSVVMNYNNGQLFYTVDIDGSAPRSLGSSDWRGWALRAIGDFAGDGKDDVVLFHELTGSMVLCADGNLDSYVSIGQLAADDWFVVGAGDYNGDQKDDLLVRQYSTGMLGYYICADQSQWVEMGRGVGMEWTVIA